MFFRIRSIFFMTLISMCLLAVVVVYGDESYYDDLVDVKVEHLLLSEQEIFKTYAIDEKESKEIISESSLDIGTSDNSDIIIDNIEKINTDIAENLSMTTIIDEVSVNNRLSTLYITEDTYVWPVAGYYDLSSPYGWRDCPFHGREFHSGIDIPAPAGTPIRATKAGVIIESSYKGGYGNCVILRHTDNTTSLYAHLLEKGLSVGTEVVQGEMIGKVGSTGNSTGNHLHFEFWNGISNSNSIDPMSVLIS